MSKNTEMVIQYAGLRLQDADERIIAIAEVCLKRCYYLDLAAMELRRYLGVER